MVPIAGATPFNSGGEGGRLAGDGGDGEAKDCFLHSDDREATVSAPPAPPAADASAYDGGAASPATRRSKTAAAAAAAAGPAAEDSRLLYAALVAASRAGEAVADADFCQVWSCSDQLRGSEVDLIPHVWVVRVDPPGVPWPPPSPSAAATSASAALAASASASATPAAAASVNAVEPASSASAAASPLAAEADVLAGAAALLTAAGATPPVFAAVGAKGTPKDVRVGAGDPVRALATSGGAADATYTRVAGGRLEEWLGDGSPASWGLPHLATPDVRRRVAGVNASVRRLLGNRPALVFSFGADAMNPVGGVMAVAWSPTLIVGLLLECVST